MPQKGDSAAWCGCQGDGPDKSQALHRTKASFSFKVYCNRKPCINSQTTHILDRNSPALGRASSSVKGPRETLFTSAKSNSLSCFKTNLVWFFHSFALLTPHTPLLPGAQTIASFLPTYQGNCLPKPLLKNFPGLDLPSSDLVGILFLPQHRRLRWFIGLSTRLAAQQFSHLCLSFSTTAQGTPCSAHLQTVKGLNSIALPVPGS